MIEIEAKRIAISLGETPTIEDLLQSCMKVEVKMRRTRGFQAGFSGLEG